MLVSGANFVASIILVRGLGLAVFGKFALAYAIFLYVNDMQRDPLTVPMFAIGTLLRGEERLEFLNGILSLQIFASMAVFVLALVAGMILRMFSSLFTIPEILSFACCLAVFQLQDWVRRYYFLTLRGKLAIVNDAMSYLGQLILFTVLWKTRHLTLFSTYSAMCVTSLIAAAMILFTDHMQPAARRLRQTWERCKTFSRDIVVTTQVRWLGTQGMIFIGNGIIGTAATGGLRATLNLAGPVNVLSTSMDNFIPLRLGDELLRGGIPAAFRFIRKSVLAGVTLFAAILIPIAIFGHQILLRLYGVALLAFYAPMLLQLVNVMLSALGRLCFHLYRGLQETAVMMQANFVTAMATMVSIYPLSKRYGAVGVVLSGLLGQIINIAYAILYWYIHRNRLLRKILMPDTQDLTAARHHKTTFEADIIENGLSSAQ